MLQGITKFLELPMMWCWLRLKKKKFSKFT